MNHAIAHLFRKRLDTLKISDFHGLISPGLTCYLNSVLQVLFMTEEFRDRIKRCSRDKLTVDTHLKDLFTSLEKNRTRTHDITKLLGIDDVYEQRDAAEYFEKILRLTSPKSSEIFKGELMHMTECNNCKKSSDARGFFWMLPLSIPDPHQTYEVERGLEDFFSSDKVDGENKMYCTQCDKKQEAVIMCKMTQPPDVLTLLLKRFHYDYKLKRNVKLNCDAEVPLMLQIEDCTYDLYAMVKHYGTLSEGHYVAYIYSIQTKEWYCFDDERVKLKRNYFVSGKAFLRSRSAYLLMYMKRGRDCESGTENKEEVLNSDNEAKETLTEATNPSQIPSSKSQRRLNGVLNSADSIMQCQESSSKNHVSHRKIMNRVGISTSKNLLGTSDNRRDKCSSKRGKRSDHTAVLQKRQAWKL